jgi:alkylated DNA repair dioxygenase AlkB
MGGAQAAIAPKQRPQKRSAPSSAPEKKVRVHVGAVAPTTSKQIKRGKRAQLDGASYLEHVPSSIPTTKAAFEELWCICEAVPPTPNPYNPATLIRRKQATLGASYTFSGQRSHQLPPNTADLRLIKCVKADVAARCMSDLKSRYTMVHINWYPDGRAGISPHADNEDIIEPDTAIFSYTFLSNPAAPRPFQVYAEKGNKLVHDVHLGDGDLLVMGGKMQRFYTHGMKASAAKRFSTLRRINITVRAIRASKI